VQPYNLFAKQTPATVGSARLYHVELWPVGNRFEAGHRIRLDILGASGASQPGAPAVNTVTVGGASGSRLMFPMLPCSDLRASLGVAPAKAAVRRRARARRRRHARR